jgi:hypothetical protein
MSTDVSEEHIASICFMLVSRLADFSTLKTEATYSSDTKVTFNGLHGVISQMIEAFLITAVRT